MPLLELNRTPLSDARARLARQRDTQRSARAELTAAQTELADKHRLGAGAGELKRQQKRIDQLSARALDITGKAQAQLGAIRELSDRLLQQRDEAHMVQALDTSHPVMLMPVSIQTRYDDATTQLMIRIYPDALHSFQHEPGLTPSEIAEAKRYWSLRYETPADSESPWKQIALLFGPMRAAYLVRILTPTNAALIGQVVTPDFDDAAVPLASPDAREVVAAALPDRFVAIGTLKGVEVLRKWGRAVADLLPLSPLFDPLLVEDPALWNPFDGDRAWLVDYDAAVNAGMAITVRSADLKGGAKLADGLDRLVVLGVDWTQTPESAAALVAELLDNHQHAEGLKFVAQGTPTNNTGSVRAGFAANAADVAAALDPTQADAQAAAVADALAAAASDAPVLADELAGAGARLQLLLGLPQSGFDATLVPGADLQEGATSGHMINALWKATLGYTLRYFWNPLDPAHTLVDDKAIELLRAHAVRYVRPSGPLSTLRVGSQPYGILPITAKGFVPAINSPLERELHEAIGWFRNVWQAAVPRVPTMRQPAADRLHQVLAMQPWSVAKRFWQVAGPAQIANYPDIQGIAFAQSLFVQFILADLLGKQPFSLRSPFLATCAVRPKPHSLDAVAWVQRDPEDVKRELPPDVPLARDYIATLLALLSTASSDPRSALTAMENADALLEALLAFAADEEVLHSGRELFYGHLDKSRVLSAAAKLQARSMRYSEYNGVDTATLVGDQFDLGHADAVLGLKLVGTTGEQSVAQFIGNHLGQAVLNWPEALKNIATFNQSLAFLQQRKVGELDHALRTTLDIAAHRLDAWITSLATKRLDQMRETTPGGLHLGAWGVVEDLRPDSALRDQRTADSQGYVHAPSLQQATTAAVLRSGHLANRDGAAGAFDIDLRSHRVKRAKRLLEGVANGQSMAALLGYRFERLLRDHDLSQHILDYRRAFALRPTRAGAEVGEDISARDVVDGVALVDAYREKGIAAISPASVPAADRPKVALQIDDLIDLIDAVSDLLVSESVHQIVGGNLDGAGAAMLALDKQSRPPEPRVIETPHSTRGYTQRVVVVMQTVNAGSWAPMNDIAAQAEPRLNAWLARLLGAPERYRFAARVLQRIDTGEAFDGRPLQRWDDSGNTLEAGLGELGLSPLALVMGSEPQTAGGQSALQERLAALLGAKARAAFGANADDMAVVLQPDAPAGAPAGSAGLVEFESLCWLLRRLLDKTRALRRMDMVQARNGVETDATSNDGEFAGIDVAELAARLAIVDARADTVVVALTAAIAAVPVEPEGLDAQSPATMALLAALQAALAQAEALGWRSALASQPVADGGATGEQVASGDTVAAAHARASALLAEVTARREAAPTPAPGDRLGEQVRKVLDRIGAVLGKAFPLLPVFDLGGFASESAPSLAARDQLLGGDDLAIAGWLPKLGAVRETTGLLCDAISAAEATGVATQGDDFKLLQTSAQADKPVKRWGALPPDADDDLRGVVAVVAHAPGALASLKAADKMAGLFVDEWMETIPAKKETTGLSFHFDAPGARAPQSVLLAVPHDKSLPNWTLEALLGVVDEAMALARLRAVRPQDLQGLGLVLPGLYLSNNFKRDVPSLDFAQLVEKNLAVLRAAYDQNTPKSFMKMAAGTTVISE
ncbi:MAG: hypothetical protein ABIQ60_07760 [Burkholderiaceae bacterium]